MIAFSRTLMRKTVRDLLTFRVQVLSAALLVACGVGLLLSSLNAWNGLRQARDEFYRNYHFADLFGSLKRAPLSGVRELEHIPGVFEVEPRIRADGLISVAGQAAPASGLFLSIPAGIQPRLNRLHLLKGRLPGDADEVCLHVAFAQAHRLEPGMSLSVQVEGTRKTLQITCVALSPEYIYALSPQAPLPDDLHFGVAWLARGTLERLTGLQGAFNDFSARVDPSEDRQIGMDVEKLLRRYGGRTPVFRHDQMSNQFVEDEIREQQVIALFFPFIFLTVAAFLIHAMSARLIALHRSQIGTLKAMGYRNFEVGLHYIGFSMAVPMLGYAPGVLIGSVFGSLLSHSYAGFFRFPHMSFGLGVGSLVLSGFAALSSGCIGGISSVRLATRLAPAEAMRPLRPARFHGKGGMGARLRNVRSRMVLRNLTQSPWRLGMTLLGLAMAISLLIMGGSWSDLIRELLWKEFSVARKEDFTLVLRAPVRESGLQELRGLDGVWMAEGVRSLPVRIRHENHAREVLLSGWDQNAKLRELPLTNTQSARLGAGIVLSRNFTTDWGIRAGDRVAVEFLEGVRPPTELPVVGFSEDRMGRTATLDEAALFKILDSSSAWNEVLLKVDPLRLEALEQKFAQMPLIVAARSKRALLKGFRGSVGAVIEVTTGLIGAFALAICLGIVTNSVRVSLSERMWELCSLRVLGFDIHQVFALLGSEVLVQAVLGVLPGCWLGFHLVHWSLEAIHTESMSFPVILYLSTYARSIAVFLGALAGSGFLVWRRVGRLNLSEALKARD